MTYVQQENYTAMPQGGFKNDDVHIFPRCSTPIIDSQVLYLPQEENRRNKNDREKSREYGEWKKRLEREKSSRIFKLRGTSNTVRSSCLSTNCSMISGHFEPQLANRISEETIARPAPVYHKMWLPISHPSAAFWNNCHHQNTAVWCETPVQQPQHFYQTPAASPPVFGASGAAAFFNILSNANYHHIHHHHPHAHPHHHHHHPHLHNHNNINNNNNNLHHGMQSLDYYPAKPAQPMQYNANNYAMPAMTTGHFYYQYHYPAAQFFTYCSGIQGNSNYLPFHGSNVFPVMMNS